MINLCNNFKSYDLIGEKLHRIQFYYLNVEF